MNRAPAAGTARILITGGAGCIGAATVYHLIEKGAAEVHILSRTGNQGNLSLWFDDLQNPQIHMIKGDVTDRDSMIALVREIEPTQIVHLAAFQSPDCDAQPDTGLAVNVGGTRNILAAAESLPGGIERFVFASSAAVYGSRFRYPGPTVKESDPLLPPNLYGVWKVAGEHLARLYYERTGVPTICVRLSTTFGKGRDRGTTSAPTRALKAIALGAYKNETIPYRMPYRGRETYHYVGDVGAQFAGCTLDPFNGFEAFNLRGRTAEVKEFLTLISECAGSLELAKHCDIGFSEQAESSMFVCDLDDSKISAAFPALPRTEIAEGIRLSLESFLALARKEHLTDI